MLVFKEHEINKSVIPFLTHRHIGHIDFIHKTL